MRSRRRRGRSSDDGRTDDAGRRWRCWWCRRQPLFSRSFRFIRARTALATDGSSNTITLDASASGNYKGCTISILSGSGAGQSRNIEAYDIGTQVATVHLDWDETPDSSSVYQITAGYSVWDEDVVNAHQEYAESAGSQLYLAKSYAQGANTESSIAAASAGPVLVTSLTTTGGTTTRLNDTVGLAGADVNQYLGCRLRTHGGDNEALRRYIVASGDGYVQVFPPLPVAVLTGWIYSIYASAPVPIVEYPMKVWMSDDDAAGTPADRYTIQFYRGMTPITNGADITSPIITVFDGAGADLIDAEALTQIGTKGAFKYVAEGAERTADGVQYMIEVTATIDGAARTWRQPVSRDS